MADLAQAGLTVSHPLLKPREQTRRAILLVLTANRGLCGGYNGNVIRAAVARLEELRSSVPEVRVELSGKRGIATFKFRGIGMQERYTHFEDKPSFAEVDVLANRYLEMYATEQLDRLDVALHEVRKCIGRQMAVVETLLPLGALAGADAEQKPGPQSQYEFLAVGRKHSGGSGSNQLQGQAFQVLPRLRRLASRSPAWWR